MNSLELFKCEFLLLSGCPALVEFSLGITLHVFNMPNLLKNRKIVVFLLKLHQQQIHNLTTERQWKIGVTLMGQLP